MPDTTLQIHPKFLPLLIGKDEVGPSGEMEIKPWTERNGYRYYVMHGGRAGLKTWACVQAIVTLCDKNKLKAVCCREIQKNIRESVHAEIAECILRMDLVDRYEVQVDRIINKFTGSEITFMGLKNNPRGIKGLANTDICWVEEAEAVAKASWKPLTPTMRKPGSEIWVTFNPDDEMDETYVRFISKPRRNSWVIETSYRDAEAVGWFNPDLREEMEQAKEEDYDDYLNTWLGVPNSNYEGAIIKKEWWDAAIDAHEKLKWEPIGEKIGSFDPADTGDEKAIAVRQGFLVENLENWNNGNIEFAVSKAFSETDLSGCTKMIFDADGLGAAMKINLDHNEKKYQLTTQEFHGGSAVDGQDDPYPPIDPNKPYPSKVVTNKNRFRNKRAQYYWFLRDRLYNTYNAVTNGVYVNPEDCISISSNIPEPIRMEARRQVSRIRRKRGSGESTIITLESKADMKKAGVKSPGLADCLMMVFAQEEEFGNRIKLNMKPIC